MPIIGWILISLLPNSLGIFDDPVAIFIIVVSYATPSAINLLILSNLYSNTVNEVSNILLISYVASILSLPIVMTILLNYLIY
jgi:predicted permease